MTVNIYTNTFGNSLQGPIQEQRKEIAAVIQRCYKRYKQVRVNIQLALVHQLLSWQADFKCWIIYPDTLLEVISSLL